MGSTVSENREIDGRSGIRSRTARKWLNRLEYKWRKVQKGVFFDEYERKDVVEYKKTFLDEMKSLLLYLVQFSDNGSMVPKEYRNDYAVRRPD